MTLTERCSPIQLLVLDVDGVLTDGRIVYTNRGDEIKAFHVRDGSGIKAWQSAGKTAAVITGRTSDSVSRRMAELGVRDVVQGVDDKLDAFRNLLRNHSTNANQVCCIGDDVTDVSILRACGFAVAVADACSDIRRISHWTTRAPGGHGAVREVIELILRCQGHWPS